MNIDAFLDSVTVSNIIDGRYNGHTAHVSKTVHEVEKSFPSNYVVVRNIGHDNHFLGKNTDQNNLLSIWRDIENTNHSMEQIKQENGDCNQSFKENIYPIQQTANCSDSKSKFVPMTSAINDGNINDTEENELNSPGEKVALPIEKLKQIVDIKVEGQTDFRDCSSFSQKHDFCIKVEPESQCDVDVSCKMERVDDCSVFKQPMELHKEKDQLADHVYINHTQTDDIKIEDQFNQKHGFNIKVEKDSVISASESCLNVEIDDVDKIQVSERGKDDNRGSIVASKASTDLCEGVYSNRDMHNSNRIQELPTFECMAYINQIPLMPEFTKDTAVPPRVECKTCGKTFKKQRYLEKHQEIHLGLKPFKCTVCDKSFNSSYYLSTHMKVHSDERPYKCDVCQMTFKWENVLESHWKSHTSERPYQCPTCGNTYKRKSTLQKHIKDSHSSIEKPKCDICGKEFLRKSGLQQHMVLHTGIGVHTCDICGVEFTTSFGLKAHQSVHTGIKPFKCNVCEASFRTKTTLKNHSRSHTNEKPYHCQICKAKFKNPTSLYRHKMIHTGKKPYECELCEQKFNQSCSLTRHYFQVHKLKNTFKCTKCSRFFIKQNMLDEHLVKDHGKKNFITKQ